MERQCWVCKNTEEYFLKQKEELIKSIEQEIAECDNFEKTIIDTTKERLGFTDAAKERVKSIKPEYASMTLNAVLENKDSFIKLDPNLETIINYCHNSYTRNYKTVNDVIQDFLLEPKEDRYKSDLSRNESKRKSLLNKKAELEKINTFFFEKEITASGLDSSISQLSHNQSEYERFTGNNYNHNFKQNDNFRFSFRDLGFSFSKKVYLCPICLSLFIDSANASLNIMKGIQDAQRAADWDDD